MEAKRGRKPPVPRMNSGCNRPPGFLRCGGLRVRQPGWDIEGSAADRLVWKLLIYVIKVIFSGSHINNDQVITLAQSIKWQQICLVVNTVPLQIIVIRSLLHQSVALHHPTDCLVAYAEQLCYFLYF